MKRDYLFLMSLISLLPLTGNAEQPKIDFNGWPGVPTMSTKAVYAAADRYGAIYCKEGLKALK